MAAYLARRTGVAGAEAALDETAHRLADAEPGADDAYAVALERYLSLGGADLEVRAPAVLDRLGLGGIAPDRTIDTLSGGQVARTGLAAVLLSQADVLLLDEAVAGQRPRGARCGGSSQGRAPLRGWLVRRRPRPGSVPGDGGVHHVRCSGRRRGRSWPGAGGGEERVGVGGGDLAAVRWRAVTRARACGRAVDRWRTDPGQRRPGAVSSTGRVRRGEGVGPARGVVRADVDVGVRSRRSGTSGPASWPAHSRGPSSGAPGRCGVAARSGRRVADVALTRRTPRRLARWATGRPGRRGVRPRRLAAGRPGRAGRLSGVLELAHHLGLGPTSARGRPDARLDHRAQRLGQVATLLDALLGRAQIAAGRQCARPGHRRRQRRPGVRRRRWPGAG